MLAEGRLVEQGSHTELVARGDELSGKRDRQGRACSVGFDLVHRSFVHSYIRDGASIPNRFKPCLRTRALRSHKARRL